MLDVYLGVSNCLSESYMSCVPSSYDYQTLDYDIMLIKLFHPVKLTGAVKPIPLPSGCPYGGMPCTVAGWGKTSPDGGE